MFFKEIIGNYCEKNTEHCGQKLGFLDFMSGGTCIYHRVLKYQSALA